MFLVPTRDRPEAIRELISSCYLYGMPKCAVMIDGDPKAYAEIRWPKSWVIHVAQRHLKMVGATNELVRLHPDEPWYGFLNDRARPHETGWQEKLLDSMNGGWANQKSLGEKNGRIRMKNGVMDGCLVRALGWFWPPQFTHFFVDDAMEDVLYGAGLFHQTDSDIEEQPIRKLPRIHNGESFWEKDRQAYEAFDPKSIIESTLAC